MTSTAEIKARFEAALLSFVDKIKKDTNIRAVILYGSLANDTVWEKSDMDVVVLVRETKTCSPSFCIDEDGIILNASIETEFEFKRWLEGRDGSTRSYLQQSRVIYTKDESLKDFINDFQKVGADDKALAFFQNSTWLLGTMEKIEKWLTVKDDPLYAQLWCLKATELYANMRLILDGKPSSRESIIKVLAYAPEDIKHLYERPMQGFMSGEEVWDMLNFYKKFLEDNLDLLKKPITHYMSDGAARTITTLVKHFGLSAHEIYHAFDFLEEMGIVARVTESVRLTPKNRTMVDEVAFIYVENMN
ncbi:MAG: nucleotidyltransferase domain-containing protein [Defluviitaleaceae bacterium]|nr:nucleotidyltransferase domain-containing protein [Defluviitaleaceae bacterium]